MKIISWNVKVIKPFNFSFSFESHICAKWELPWECASFQIQTPLLIKTYCPMSSLNSYMWIRLPFAVYLLMLLSVSHFSFICILSVSFCFFLTLNIFSLRKPLSASNLCIFYVPFCFHSDIKTESILVSCWFISKLGFQGQCFNLRPFKLLSFSFGFAVISWFFFN